MILKQQLLLPMIALLKPRALFVFPGFPPSPLFSLVRERVVLYVHDLFLMDRKRDLGLKARLYMAPSFAFAIRRLKYFMTNSEKTSAELLPRTRGDAQITLYRPYVRNVFALDADGRAARTTSPSPLRIVMVGTIEPRKNYRAAVAIRDALERRGFASAELHIIGREGWGDAAHDLRNARGIALHGYLSLPDAKRVIEQADLYLSTSHDEGLGLPLLEAQYAGLAVVAPDLPVFREVLGSSGLLVDVADADGSAAAIARLLSTPDWRQVTSVAAFDNVRRWNETASRDASRARGVFEHSLEETMQPAPSPAA
jgi:glycosyltransferase involved in cell wall biosynthesis